MCAECVACTQGEEVELRCTACALMCVGAVRVARGAGGHGGAGSSRGAGGRNGRRHAYRGPLAGGGFGDAAALAGDGRVGGRSRAGAAGERADAGAFQQGGQAAGCRRACYNAVCHAACPQCTCTLTLTAIPASLNWPFTQAQDGGEDAGAPSFAAPEDVAVADPLAGLLLMDPLPRLRFLLDKYSHPEVLQPALALLMCCAAAGAEPALQVVRCSGMPAALAALASGGGGRGDDDAPDGQPAASSECSDASAEPASQESRDAPPASVRGGPQPAALAAAAAVRVSAMRLLRLLCTASPMAMQLLRTAGVLAHAQAALASASLGAGVPAAGQQEGQQLLQLEALRIWRVAASQVGASGQWKRAHTWG